MLSKYKYYILTVVALIAALAVYLSRYSGTSWPPASSRSDLESPKRSDLLPAGGNPLVQTGVYRNAKFAFELSIPDGFKVTETNPDEFTTLVLVEASGKTLGVDGLQTPSVEERAGFQIFIMPFDEPGPITKERILIDMPDAIIDDPKMVQINGIEAFLFFGEDEDLGRTREVWFANDGYLYQVSSWASFDEELSKIMRTFKFK